MPDYPQNQFLKKRRRRPAIFRDKAGQEYRENVVLAVENRGGPTNYGQIPAGTIVGFHKPSKKFYPLAYAKEESGTSNANIVNVGRAVEQFHVGDWVELPQGVAYGAERFRKVTDVDTANQEITVDGSSFNLSQGDDVEVDPTRSFDSVQNSGTNTQNTVDVGDGSKFEAGDRVDIGPPISIFTLSLPDGTYSGTVSVSAQILDEEGAVLHDIEAEVDASSSTEDTIMSELASQLDDQLSNYDGGSLGAVSSSAGPPATLTVSLAEPDHDFTYTWSDNEISASISASEDDSTGVEVVSVSGNTLTLAKTITFSNGEQVVSGPDGGYTVLEKTADTSEDDYVPSNVMVAARDRGKVDESQLMGLTPTAREALATQIKFMS
ncbi:MAG: hypothetical protein ABEN55_09545 [Bradymonadaceae bacterium]